jgi:predicted NBD/HSP70 family sugar kinase
MSHTTNGDAPADRPAATPGGGDAPVTDVHERARQGVEHLQAAAREMIEAARAALDVAEELVNDPEAVASLAGMVATVGDLARRVAGAGAADAAPGDGDPTAGREADGPPGRVERIRVR